MLLIHSFNQKYVLIANYTPNTVLYSEEVKKNKTRRDDGFSGVYVLLQMTSMCCLSNFLGGVIPTARNEQGKEIGSLEW